MPNSRAHGPAGVNWTELRRRVDEATRAVAGEACQSDERARAVLDERARVLAQPAASPLAADALEVVTFTLGRETYAVESRYVIAVFRLAELSRLPGAEPPVFGVTAWRGALLTILDLRQVLGVSAPSLNDLARVVVLGDDRPAFGILGDTVVELVMLPITEIRETADLAIRSEYFRGVTTGAVLVLDTEKLLRAHG